MNWKDLPNRPEPGARLCVLADIPDHGGLEVRFGEGSESFRVLLLRQGQQVWTYLNFCPHFSLPLNYRPQTFLVLDDAVICAHHTAFFNFSDGRCTDGPCVGNGLIALPHHRAGAEIRFGAAPAAHP